MSSDETALDALISEAVDALGEGVGEFTERAGGGGSIAALAQEMNLIPPARTVGSARDGSFLFFEDGIGHYFHAQLPEENVKFFVPTACHATVLQTNGSGIQAYLIDPYLDISSHPLPEGVTREAGGAEVYAELPCAGDVKVRLYYLDGLDQRRRSEIGAKVGAIMMYRQGSR